MPDSVFKAIGVVLGMLIGGAGITRFKELFAQPKQIASQLAQAFNSARKLDRFWVRDQWCDLAKILFSPRLILSLFYLIVLIGLTLLVWIGPEEVLDPASWGVLAQPLTLGERTLYYVLVLPVAALYVWVVLSPALSGWKMFCHAALWLLKKENR